MNAPNILVAYTAILLRAQQRFLLLQRSASKRFAPNRWTGIGGLVEAHEYNDLRASALRELEEETGITGSEVDQLRLRRVLLHNRLPDSLTLLLYYTGVIDARPVPDSNAGTLEWVTTEQLAKLDVIENTRQVLPLLIADMVKDPVGQERILLGVAHYIDERTLDRMVWV